MTDFFKKNLEETIAAINILIENKKSLVNTRKVKKINKIKKSNRSKTNFIWRSLQFLEKHEILEKIDGDGTITYKIKSETKIDIPEFINTIN